jgi:hypothetical protein
VYPGGEGSGAPVTSTLLANEVAALYVVHRNNAVLSVALSVSWTLTPLNLGGALTSRHFLRQISDTCASPLHAWQAIPSHSTARAARSVDAGRSVPARQSRTEPQHWLLLIPSMPIALTSSRCPGRGTGKVAALRSFGIRSRTGARVPVAIAVAVTCRSLNLI